MFGILKIRILRLFRVSSLEFRVSFARERKGLTTLELIIGIGIFAILAGGFGALVQLYGSYGYILPREKLESEVRRLHLLTIEDLKRSIRQGESVQSNYTVDSTTYTTGTTTLVLQLRAIDASQNIISGSYDTFLYFVNTTTPPIKFSKRIVPASGSSRSTMNIVFNDMVQSLSFTYNSTTTSLISKVTTSLTTQKTVGTLTQGASSTVEITLR